MKTDIHPAYFTQAQIRCACGNEITVGSTVERMTVEVCSACHPFYTGKQKLVDTAGRIEKFEKRLKAATTRGLAAKSTTRRRTRKGASGTVVKLG